MIKTNSTLAPICFNPKMKLLDLLQAQDEAVQQGHPAGLAIIVDENKRLIGTITDGDLRRASLKYRTYDITADQLMQPQPIYFPEHYTYQEIIQALPTELAKRGRSSKKFLSKIILTDEEQRPSRILEYHQLWEQRVASHRHVVVLGMGYVGFTLALVLADKGFKVTGVDIDADRVNALNRGNSYIHEKGLEEIFQRQLNENFQASAAIPQEGDVFIISVGTPVTPDKEGKFTPNLNALEAVAKTVGSQLKNGNLVVLRSTVPLGTTRQVVLPILEKMSGLKAGTDFHLSFAPERTAEGKAIKELRELPQLIGGINKESLEATAALFRDLTPTIVRLKSIEQAELAKLLNNCFRDLVFSFSNQVTQIAQHFNIDIVETIRAANQGYPRNPIPLPSPGVGGACLTKDPYIFSATSNKLGFENTLFEHSRQINESMHEYVVNRVLSQLQQIGKPPANATILVCGLAFKGEPETGDIRNSSSIEIAHLLLPKVKHVFGHDPVASEADILEHGITPIDLSEGLQQADAVLFLNNHRFYEKLDVHSMLKSLPPSPIIFDGWKIFTPENILQTRPCIYMGISSTMSSIDNTLLN